MNTVLLVMGIGLLACGQPPAAGEQAPAAEAAPDPLPLLQAPGLPPPELPGKTELETVQAPGTPPAPLKTAPPQRPPAFRRVMPDRRQETSAYRPNPPPVAAPAPAPPQFPADAVLTPTVTLEKTGPAAVRAGEPFAYEIVLRNVGPVPAVRAMLVDELPPGTRVLAAQPAPVAQGERLVWEIEGIAPGAESRFRVEVQPAQGGAWKGAATLMVSASRSLETAVSGPAPSPPAAPPPEPAPEPQIALEVVGPAGAVVQGYPLTFQVRVGNRGAAPLAGLALLAHLPPGLEHYYGNDIELGLEPLNPGQSRVETLEVIAALPGRHAMDIAVRGPAVRPAAARAEVTVRQNPHLAVRLFGPKEAWTDREMEFRLEVANRSQAEARDVVVLDRLPPGVALVGGLSGGTYDRSSRTVRWVLGRLAPGQSRTLSVKLLARAAGPALNDILVRTGQGHEARLQTVLKFRPPRAPNAAAPAAARTNN